MIDSMKQLYIDQLRDLYHAEDQLLKALPRMANAANSTELKRSLGEHHNETQEQMKRLEKIFEMNGEQAAGRKCKAMQGLIAETDDMLAEGMEPEIRGAAIIANAQRIEHYEMAGYGTARAFANMLDQDEASELLQATLEEEASADETLTKLATEYINRQAIKA